MPFVAIAQSLADQSRAAFKEIVLVIASPGIRPAFSPRYPGMAASERARRWRAARPGSDRVGDGLADTFGEDQPAIALCADDAADACRADDRRGLRPKPGDFDSACLSGGGRGRAAGLRRSGWRLGATVRADRR